MCMKVRGMQSDPGYCCSGIACLAVSTLFECCCMLELSVSGVARMEQLGMDGWVGVDV